MFNIVEIEIPKLFSIKLQLDQDNSPETVKQIVKNLPFSVTLNVWGKEIYTSESLVAAPLENAKSSVHLNDVAYWPPGKAICLFFGPTPISKKGEIKPASPVNLVGKILSPDESVLGIADGKTATFSLRS